MGNSCSGPQDAAQQMAELLRTIQQQGQQQAELLRTIQQQLKRKDEQYEMVKANSMKASGNYFVINSALWRKEYVVEDFGADKGSCKQAYELIQARLEASLKDVESEVEESKVEESKVEESKVEESKVEESNNAQRGIPDPTSCLDALKREIFQGFDKDHNIFFTSVTKDISDDTPGQKSLAHLVPANRICSVFWVPFVPLLTGARNSDDNCRFSVIHGCFDGQETQYKDIKNKGIKNVAQNLLALPPDHGKFYDGTSAGRLIIIPIVDLDKSVDHFHNRQYFDLLVVGKSKNVYTWIYNGTQSGTPDVYSVSLDATVEDATADDIRIATKFLNYYIKAAAFIAVTDVKQKLDGAFFNDMYCGVIEVLFPKPGPSSVPSSNKSQASSVGDVPSSKKSQASSVCYPKDAKVKELNRRKESISKVLQKIVESKQKPGLCVPELHRDFNCQQQKVLKVKLKKYFNDLDLDLKLYPSWGPLGMKATANWLCFAGQPFIPSCMDQVPFPIPSIEIDSNVNCSYIDLDKSDDLSMGSSSPAVLSPWSTDRLDTPAIVTP